VPLLPLQTLVDFQLLYCGKHSPYQLMPTSNEPELWPIGQNSPASDSNEDDLVHRSETSIFHDELATSVHLGDPNSPINVVSRSNRPVSMFEVYSDGRYNSTATMSTGFATKDERAPGGMSDEARAAMMDVAGYTPWIAVDRPSSAGRRVRSPPSSSPGVPLSKVAAELQTARQLTSKAIEVLESEESRSTASDGKGDARTPASTFLYPEVGGSSAKTLLDYYSARVAERKSIQLTKHPYPPPRVTMNFFPSRDKDAMTLATTPTPSTDESPVSERSTGQQPQSPPRRMQSAADGLWVPNSAVQSQQNEQAASITPTPKSDFTQYLPRRMQSAADGLRAPAAVSGHRSPRNAAATSQQKVRLASPTAKKSDSTPTQSPPRRMQSAGDGLRAPTGSPPTVAASGQQNVHAASTTPKSDSTPTSTGPVATSKVAATTNKTTLDQSRQLPKAADRRLSEPTWATLPTTKDRQLRGGVGEATSGSSVRRVQNSSNGAATDVFLSSILSHLVSSPLTAERDWGHFTLVKPVDQSQASTDSKPGR